MSSSLYMSMPISRLIWIIQPVLLEGSLEVANQLLSEDAEQEDTYVYGNHYGVKEDNKCCARGCAKPGRLLLKINYINKTGYFCDS